MTTTTFEHKTLREIANSAIDKLNDGIGVNVYGCDLQNEIFGLDFYVIGYWNAEQWLIKHTGVFNGIEIVVDYETDNFGDVKTDISHSEAVANMVAYIVGEEVLRHSQTLQDKLDKRLEVEDIKQIVNELEQYINNL